MIDVTTLNDIPARKVGIVKVVKSKLPISMGEIDFKKQLFKLMTPLYETTYNNYMGNLYESWCCHCEKFREVTEGEMLPEYLITIKREESGEVKIIKVEEQK